MCTSKSKIFAAILISVVSFATLPVCEAVPSDLTAGYWLITGSDDGGNVWNGSTIYFLQQTPSGQDYSLAGYFQWTGNNGSLFGQENFEGTLFSNNNLQVTGLEIVPPSQGIVLAQYQADLTPSGTELINGIWGGPGTIPSSSWSAVLVTAAVPEPSSWVMLILGLALSGFAVRRRNHA